MKGAAALIVLLVAGDAAAQELAPLKNTVARLTTAATEGAGIIAGFDDTSVYVVTAAHVVPRRDVTVQFHAARQRRFAGRVQQQKEDADVAVVAVDVPEGDPVRESLQPAVYLATPVAARTAVTTIGHAAEAWESMAGVNQVQADRGDTFTFSKLGIASGASGGPVFDENERLLGMVLQIDSVKATAASVGAIVRLLRSWNVPVNLLEPQVFEKGFVFDRFVDNRHDWYHSNDPKVPVRIAKGVYLVTSPLGGGTWTARNINFDPRRDFRISCTVKNIRGVRDYFFGLMWGFRDDKHYFDVAITANGHASVSMKDGAATVDFIDPSRVNPNVNKGRATNRLTVSRRGGRLEVRINDGVVHTMPFRPFFGAGIGFVVWGDVQVAFDDLEVEVD